MTYLPYSILIIHRPCGRLQATQITEANKSSIHKSHLHTSRTQAARCYSFSRQSIIHDMRSHSATTGSTDNPSQNELYAIQAVWREGAIRKYLKEIKERETEYKADIENYRKEGHSWEAN